MINKDEIMRLKLELKERESQQSQYKNVICFNNNK